MGLDLSEVGYFFLKFECVFVKVCEVGFLVVVYVGEEGVVEYVWEVLDLFKVNCIDYGVCFEEDFVLM